MGSVMAGVQRRGSLTPVCICTGAARCPCPRRLVNRALMTSRQRGGERGFGGLGEKAKQWPQELLLKARDSRKPRK
jgi:hypothetical protein